MQQVKRTSAFTPKSALPGVKAPPALGGSSSRTSKVQAPINRNFEIVHHSQAKSSVERSTSSLQRSTNSSQKVAASVAPPAGRGQLPSSSSSNGLTASKQKLPGGGAFPDNLAQQVAQLCMRLATEREVQLSQLHSGLIEELNQVKAENQRLSKELAARTSSSTSPSSARRLEAQASPRRQKSREEVMNSPRASPPTTQGRGQESLGAEDDQVGVQGPTTSPRRRPSTASGTMVGFESEDQDLFVLRKVYKEIDRRRLNRVRAEDVLAEMQRFTRGQADVNGLRKAIKAVNIAMKESGEELGENRSSRNVWSDEKQGWPYSLELSFEGFQWLILKEDVEHILEEEVLATVREVRDFYVKWTTESMILERTHVAKDELHQEEEVSKIPWWLEPVIGMLILLNAVCIGLSQDFLIGSVVWTIMEVFFTVSFVAELLIKVCCLGPVEHFCGLGCVWNWFDLIILIIAVLDVVFMLLNHLEVVRLPDLTAVTIIRLIRLIRMARLVRLLRMKIFKELTLMVYGVIGGLKTLCWAFVLLAGLVFIIGVLMCQLVRMTNFDCDARQASFECTPSEEVIYQTEAILFSSVYRSMFTVFRCLIGDCNSPAGVPLAPHLMDAFGAPFTMGYVVVLCFVLFGVFNLVMAIFVENTLETARLSQQKRQQARTKEHVRVAQELREIVLRICTRERRNHNGNNVPDTMDMPEESKPSRKPSGPLGRMANFMFGPPQKDPAESLTEDALQMVVSRKSFEEVVEDSQVLAILEDLEIHVTSPGKLFDIIDANGSGQLDVGEIIEGLMKLRGPADKGDVVQAALMVRNVQRELQRIEHELDDWHAGLQDSQMKILTSVNRGDGTEERDAPGSQFCKWGFW